MVCSCVYGPELPPGDPDALPYITYPFRDVGEIIACGNQTASRLDIPSFWESASDELIGHMGDIAFAGVPYDQWHETEHWAKFVYLWKIRDMSRYPTSLDGDQNLVPVKWKEACFYHRLDGFDHLFDYENFCGVM